LDDTVDGPDNNGKILCLEEAGCEALGVFDGAAEG
jgi:hypothetical protein